MEGIVFLIIFPSTLITVLLYFLMKTKKEDELFEEDEPDEVFEIEEHRQPRGQFTRQDMRELQKRSTRKQKIVRDMLSNKKTKKKKFKLFNH